MVGNLLNKDMPHRLFQPDTPEKTRTNFFLMQITSGDPNLKSSITLGQQMFMNGSPERSNHNELNNYKKAVAETNGMSMTTSSARFHDIFQNDSGALFYYEWVHDVGAVKTMLGTPMVLKAKAMFESFFGI